jgi:hypothetical protein
MNTILSPPYSIYSSQYKNTETDLTEHNLLHHSASSFSLLCPQTLSVFKLFPIKHNDKLVLLLTTKMATQLAYPDLVKAMVGKDTLSGWDVLVTYDENKVNDLLKTRAQMFSGVTNMDPFSANIQSELIS